MAQRGAGSRGRFEFKLLIDMNLSPQWIEALADAGIEARHWSKVGDGAASDREVFHSRSRLQPDSRSRGWPFAQRVLLRTHRLLPSDSATSVVEVLRRHPAEIETGAVVVVSPDRSDPVVTGPPLGG